MSRAPCSSIATGINMYNKNSRVLIIEDNEGSIGVSVSKPTVTHLWYRVWTVYMYYIIKSPIILDLDTNRIKITSTEISNNCVVNSAWRHTVAFNALPINHFIEFSLFTVLMFQFVWIFLCVHDNSIGFMSPCTVRKSSTAPILLSEKTEKNWKNIVLNYADTTIACHHGTFFKSTKSMPDCIMCAAGGGSGMGEHFR